MKKLILSTLTAASLTMGLVGAISAADVVNGSFESGTNPGVFTPLAAVDSTTISNWTVSSGTVDYIGTYWQAADGVRSIDLNGTTAGAIRQSIATEVGKSYKVSFSLSGNPAGGTGLKTLTVDVGTAPVAFSYEVTTANGLTAMNWVSKSFTFTATSTTTVLTFTSTTTATAALWYGPALDKVKVEATKVKAFTDCKKGGWKLLRDTSGNAFRNQGDCVSYFATKFRNGAAGAR